MAPAPSPLIGRHRQARFRARGPPVGNRERRAAAALTNGNRLRHKTVRLLVPERLGGDDPGQAESTGSGGGEERSKPARLPSSKEMNGFAGSRQANGIGADRPLRQEADRGAREK